MFKFISAKNLAAMVICAVITMSPHAILAQSSEKYFDVDANHAYATIRSRVDNLVLTGFSANNGRCSAYKATYDTLEILKFPVRIGYGDQITFTVSGGHASSVPVQHQTQCWMLDYQIETNFGSWQWEIH